MSHQYVLVADSIGKRYGRRPILTSASLWATPGRITAVLGRNGVGKSTLLKVAAGWIRADYGVVILNDERFVRPRLARLATLGLFYLPERSLLCSTRTLGQHFDVIARLSSRARTEQAVTQLRLEELLGQRPPSLSGGEQRRAEMALAMARGPSCLLADEPFRGIAPTDAELLAHCLQSMAGEGCALVVTGHEVPTLLHVADEVIWLTAGTTHVLGTPDEAHSNEQFLREYLGGARPGAPFLSNQ